MRTWGTYLDALCGLSMVCGNWFYAHVIQQDGPADLTDAVPPIRYDGDPTEIHLA